MLNIALKSITGMLCDILIKRSAHCVAVVYWLEEDMLRVVDLVFGIAGCCGLADDRGLADGCV